MAGGAGLDLKPTIALRRMRVQNCRKSLPSISCKGAVQGMLGINTFKWDNAQRCNHFGNSVLSGPWGRGTKIIENQNVQGGRPYSWKINAGRWSQVRGTRTVRQYRLQRCWNCGARLVGNHNLQAGRAEHELLKSMPADGDGGEIELLNNSAFVVVRGRGARFVENHFLELVGRGQRIAQKQRLQNGGGLGNISGKSLPSDGGNASP